MSERLDAAIEEIVAQIVAKEAELNPLKIAVNQLCQINGQSPRYHVDGAGAPGAPRRNVLTWRSDQFYARPLAQCVTEYFEARDTIGLERPATIDEIHEALTKGGYKFEGTSGNEENTKRAIKISLSKNTAQFTKISENLVSLKKWYPNAKRKPASAASSPSDEEADGDPAEIGSAEVAENRERREQELAAEEAAEKEE